MSNAANLPAPYRGQDTNTPTAVLKSPFCERLYNFNTTEAGVSLRNGDAKWSSQAMNGGIGALQENMRGFVPYSQTKLFEAVLATGGAGLMRYYDISTKGGAPSVAHVSTSGISGLVYTTKFRGRVFTFGSSSSAGDYYDGTTWGAWTYTMPASFNPIGGCAYKNRQYFIGRDSSDYGYSEIDAVSGTVTKVSLDSIITETANLAAIAPFTVSNQTSSEQLLAFVFFSGEVLFYSGSYPDSATWGLVGTANIPQPLSYNSVISPYQGDSLVACYSGLISLRDLFLRGSDEAASLTLSEAITPDWLEIVNAVVALAGNLTGQVSVSMAWWKAKNRIVVSFPYSISAGAAVNGSTYFVYDTLRLSWSVHKSVGHNSLYAGSVFLTSFKQEMLFAGATLADGGSNKIMIKSKENASDFQDVNTDDSTKTSYDYEMLSAPIPFPKTAVYEAVQVEPILESDLYAQTEYNFVVDFGRQTSGDQTTDAGTTSVAKPAVNVGAQNITYVQVKMSGTTAASKTVGLDLYSYNVWYNAGETGSR